MEQEFLSLIREHSNSIHHACNIYARTLEREDMVQEILAAAWEGFPKFQKKSPFGVWFYGLCRNVCVHHLRKHLLRPEVNSITYDPPEHLPLEDEIEQQIELTKAYEECVGTLHHIEKRYFQMYLSGMSYRQMEHVTGVDENTLRVRIHRIIKRLRITYAGKKFINDGDD